MKKLLCTLAVVGLAASVFAQGQINLASGSNLVKDSSGTAVPMNGGFVQLLWGTAPLAVPWDPAVHSSLAGWLALNPTWTEVATAKAINGPVAGRFNNNIVDVATVNTINAAIAAWTGAATTFDGAIAAQGQVGISGAFSIKPGNPNATPIPELAASTAGLFPGVNLSAINVIPEPSSLALAGLGAAALLIFRRRK